MERDLETALGVVRIGGYLVYPLLSTLAALKGQGQSLTAENHASLNPGANTNTMAKYTALQPPKCKMGYEIGGHSFGSISSNSLRGLTGLAPALTASEAL